LSVEAIEQQIIIFGAASMHTARTRREEAEKLDHNISSKFWTDADVEYDLGLTKYGVDVENLQHPLAPARFFVDGLKTGKYRSSRRMIKLLKKNYLKSIMG
jgi:hypothetical protein